MAAVQRERVLDAGVCQSLMKNVPGSRVSSGMEAGEDGIGEGREGAQGLKITGIGVPSVYGRW